MDREHDPEAWVEIHANLGRVLALRQRGDVASARDGAVFHLRQAAELESELLERGRVEPEDLAHTLVMLATALTQRMDADESDDLVEAEAILRRAASLLEAGEADDLLVDCLTNLGNVQTLNGDFEGAATTYQRAMSYAEGAGSVIDVAVLRIDLATTLLLQAEADEGSEQETARAIHLLRHNLEVLDAGRHPYDRARTHATMAHALELHGDADGAVAAYRTALEVLDPETLPQAVHALPYDDGGTEVCLLDRFEVSYAPSAKTLNLLRRRRRNPQIRSCRLVALGDSRPSRGPLEHAPEEVRRVAALFPTACVRLGRDADMDFLTAALPDATHLLLACHGRFDPERPLSSYVELADDRWSARHVLDQPPPPGLRLAVLSACQSGLADFEHAPDEALGLTGALLHAGVPGVITSLLPVHDHSTALLMERFFEEHLADPDGDGRTTPPATALRKAQLWLRDEASGGELRHPYHWAAFALFGG